jgi:hypothetical protein
MVPQSIHNPCFLGFLDLARACRAAAARAWRRRSTREGFADGGAAGAPLAFGAALPAALTAYQSETTV